jgi:hypothetical protein
MKNKCNNVKWSTLLVTYTIYNCLRVFYFTWYVIEI